MNELGKPTETNRPAAQRSPVIWRIASVTHEHESVTIVFPVTNETPQKSEHDGSSGITQE